MRRYRGNEKVNAGVYFAPRRLVFRSISETGRLPGSERDVYFRVPALLLLPVGALAGLAFVIFLPVIGFVMLGRLAVEEVRARRAAAAKPEHIRMTRRVWLPHGVDEVYAKSREPWPWKEEGPTPEVEPARALETDAPSEKRWQNRVSHALPPLVGGTAPWTLDGVEEWSCVPAEGGTEVTVHADLLLPPEAAPHRATLAENEERALERKLQRLETLCQ